MEEYKVNKEEIESIMDKDIEILEKLKEESLRAAECSLSSYSEGKEWKREAQAIENLIKGYKEKDTEINKLNKVIDKMAEHIVNSAVVDDTVCCLKIGCEDKECNYEEMLSCTKKYFIEEVENE